MKDVLELIKDFEGIIGALLGVIVTLILTQLLKSVGKIRFYILDNHINLRGKINDWGIVADTENLDEAEYIIATIKLEVYNSSEIPKILREVKLCFFNDKQLLFDIKPDDEATRRVAAAMEIYEPLDNINLPPKNIIVLNLRCIIPKEKLELFKQCNKIFLEVRNHKGSKDRVLLYSMD
jgi:hypothetical protein